MFLKEESNFAFSQKRSLEIRIFFDDYLEKSDIYVCEKELVESQTFTLSFYALLQPIRRKALYSKNFRNFAFSLPGTAGNWNFFLRIAREERYFAN
jgi:hypothetical protein